MIRPQLILDLNREMIVDNFAGGGGASTGIELALGRAVDIAVNHDPEALALHEANHPQTRHLCEDVFEVDPCAATGGRPVGLAWFSPDCKHFSKAKGGKPRSKKIRGLAWVMVKWAATVAPRVMVLENVEEFQTWGPLLADGNPCPRRKGQTFHKFVGQLKALGYVVEWRELRACDFGTPTIRKRLFLIARRDGIPIVWPAPTHGKPIRTPAGKVKPARGHDGRTLRPWRSAAECIDWSIPCPSIFERAKPLVESSCKRIARGIYKFVIDAAEPFIVPLTSANGFGVVAAHLTEYYGAKREGDCRAKAPETPLPTQPTENRFGLVSAFLAKHYTGVVGSGVDDPVHTVTSSGTHIAEVRAFLVKYYGEGGQDQALSDPMHTIPTRDRIGLVTIHGVDYVITDIGMRMLQPHELFAAQGFPADYVIAPRVEGKPLSKTAQVRMCGNSVCPPVAAAIVRANVPEMAAWFRGEKKGAA